ncbi:CD63 antigen-like isoform X1 [Onthophagus taurus]|uniref:CD63 antigen-like isoform X1 n=1 Tax=Onthophagus taurus TaxID=166361 RepID=UPI000C2056D1|nr:CD63 antigen-like isoform X1 [Onthophagus taurus]
MGCASGIAKYSLFLFNLLCLLLGLAMLVVGIIFQLNISDITESIPDEYSTISYIPILMIVVGSIVFVIAFFGCCGAVKESTCMLTTYAVILLIILVIQVAFGTLAFLQTKNTDDLRTQFGVVFQRLMEKYNSAPPQSHEAVDLIQQSLKCCGTTGPHSWVGILSLPPDSCCAGPKGTCNNFQDFFFQGCKDALFDFTRDTIKIIGIIFISIAAVELVGAIFALCLSSSIKNSHRRGAYA